MWLAGLRVALKGLLFVNPHQMCIVMGTGRNFTGTM